MPDGYVTIATLSTPVEADLSKLRLESEDIPVFMLDSHIGAINPIYGVAAGVRIQVPSEFVEQALEILRSTPDSEFIGEEIFEDDDDDENDFDEYQAFCPSCSSNRIGKYNVLLSIIGMVFSFLFGMVTIRKIQPVKYNWFCKSCKEMWRAPQKPRSA